MNTDTFKKIIYINEISFFFGWTIILLMGADTPPPIGFIWLVILTVFLDVIQYFYLKRFLPNLKNKSKGLFAKNLLFFALGGIAINLITILTRFKLFLDNGLVNTLVWIMIIFVVTLLYGIYFYIVNVILIKFIR